MTDSTQPPRQEKGVIDYFLHHPVAANVLVILILVSGLFIIPQIKNTLLPDVETSFIEIQIKWPGAGAEAVSQWLAMPVESTVRNLQQVDSVHSISEAGNVNLMVKISNNADIKDLVELIKREISAMSVLPDDILTPTVKFLEFEEAVTTIGLLGNHPTAELYETALQLRADLLSSGIPKIEIEGWSTPILAIEFSNKSIVSLQLNLEQIARQIRAQINISPAGVIQQDGNNLVIQNNNQVINLRKLESLTLVAANGTELRLSDVAQINWEHKDYQQARINGQRGLMLTLFRSQSIDAGQVGKIMRQTLDQFKTKVFDDVQFIVIDDQSRTVKANRNMMLSNALMGLAVVFCMLFLFLNRHIALWTAAGIPIAVFAALIFMYYSGQTINMFTVLAFIMVLGIIVDDAIVVSEETLSLSSRGVPLNQACAQAAKRMAPPVIAATLTTIAAFLPIMFLPGYIGNMLQPIPIIIIITLLASLLECFIILPSHLYKSLDARITNRHAIEVSWGDHFFRHCREKYYQPALLWVLANKKLTIATFISAFILAGGGAIRHAGENNMNIDNDLVRNIVYFEANTPQSEINRVIDNLVSTIKQAENELADNRQLVKSWGLVQHKASNRPWLKMTVNLVSMNERSVSSQDFLTTWGKYLQPDSWVRYYGLETNSRKPGNSIRWELSGNTSLEILQNAVVEFRQQLEKIPEIARVEDSFSRGDQQLEFELNTYAHRIGINNEDIGRQIKSATDGIVVGKFIHHSAESEIRVHLPDNERSRLDKLNQLPIQIPNQGKFLPLGSVVSFSQQTSPSALERFNGQLQLSITAHFYPHHIQSMSHIRRKINNEILPEITQRYGLGSKLSNLMEQETASLQEAFLVAFPIACLLIYLIMVWMLRSFSWPLIIIAVIPVGLSGAVFGHILLAMPFSLDSVFGCFGVAGIVVNDAIILFSEYRRLKDKYSFTEAIVKAGSHRFRAIILTTLTTVVGLLPLLLDSSPNALILHPMAVSLSFGLIFGSLLLLFLVPCLLAIIEQYHSRKTNSASAVAKNDSVHSKVI